MKSDIQPKPLLWNDRRTIAMFAIALLITLAIAAAQIVMRKGVLDPDVMHVFYRLFLLDDYPAALLSIAVLLIALVPKVQSTATRLVSWMGERPVLTTTSAGALLALGAVLVYQAHPLAMDEYAPYLQSQIFVAGRLLGQFPPELVDWLIFPGFKDYFIHVSDVSGEIASAYWPGFALLLTPFTAAGVPWLCNPVLAAAAIATLYGLTRTLTGSRTAAGAAILLSVASAAFVINAISFYSMTAHLLCNALFMLLLLDPTPRRSLLAGLVGGLALTLHNPVPHLLFAIPWLAWLVWRPDRSRTLPLIALGYLPWIIVIGFGWQYLLLSLSDGTQGTSPAASPDPLGQALTLVSAVFRLPDVDVIEARTVGLAKLWLWGAPGLVLLALLGAWNTRRKRPFQLLFASGVLTFVGFLFVPVDQGHGWGFRYFHSAWFILPLFAAAVIGSATEDADPAKHQRIDPFGRYGLGSALAALVILVPYFGWRVHTFIGNHLAQLPTAESGVPHLVIINPFAGYYAQDLVQNDPFLRDGVIRMVTRGRANDLAMIEREFPDLVLLAHTHRGSVWGYPVTDEPLSPGRIAREQHGK